MSDLLLSEIPREKRAAWSVGQVALRRAAEAAELPNVRASEYDLAQLYLRTTRDHVRPFCAKWPAPESRPARELVVWLSRAGKALEDVREARREHRDRTGACLDRLRVILDNAEATLLRWVAREQHDLLREESEEPGYGAAERERTLRFLRGEAVELPADAASEERALEEWRR